jgi:hypothetical protein
VAQIARLFMMSTSFVMGSYVRNHGFAFSSMFVFFR